MTRAYKQRAVVPLADRLFAMVDASGPCWLWTGTRPNGYGTVALGRRTGNGRVHRVVWELLVGPIPQGMELDHLCRVRHCCNPDHLELVTRQINVDRGARRARMRRKTHCKNGHEFTPDNTIPNGTHGRACRTCKNAAARRYRRRLSA